MGYGNGVALEALRIEARAMSFEDFRVVHGRLFLLVQVSELAAAEAVATTRSTAKSKAHGAPQSLVFPLKRGPGSQFDWISVGRNAGNDVYLPHASISRFQAFFRMIGSDVFVQDARSSNGTFVGETAVARHGDGPAMVVTPGAVIRFGDVPATFLNAEGLFAILTKLA